LRYRLVHFELTFSHSLSARTVNQDVPWVKTARLPFVEIANLSEMAKQMIREIISGSKHYAGGAGFDAGGGGGGAATSSKDAAAATSSTAKRSTGTKAMCENRL
jgi:hypothetical protein